jgi:UDP-N-acetylglucosamine 2-epimerase (non-hydrolysing)
MKSKTFQPSNLPTCQPAHELTILHVVGARPNFMKIAPVIDEMDKHPDQFDQLLVHTGQHYDDEMSQMWCWWG